MRSFYEFLQQRTNRNDVRDQVLTAIEAGEDNEPSKTAAERSPLSAFKYEKLLKDQHVGRIISQLSDRGAIISMIKKVDSGDTNITVGMMVNAIVDAMNNNSQETPPPQVQTTRQMPVSNI